MANNGQRRRSNAATVHVPGTPPPPYPSLPMGTPAYMIADVECLFGEMDVRGPHVHFYIHGFNGMREELFTDSTEIDVVAGSESEALERAKALMPSKMHFRVSRVSIHEPNGATDHV